MYSLSHLVCLVYVLGNLESTLGHCCAIGKSWYADKKSCNITLSFPLNRVPLEHNTMCLTTVGACCLHSLRYEFYTLHYKFYTIHSLRYIRVVFRHYRVPSSGKHVRAMRLLFWITVIFFCLFIETPTSVPTWINDAESVYDGDP